jgi:hypothetical protein
MERFFMKKGKIPWHWIAGGGFALLFAILLSIRLDVFSRPGGMLVWRTTPVEKPLRSDDHWMAIKQANRKIGYAHRTLTPVEKGYRLEESVLMRINTMGVVQDLRMKTQSDLHPDMTLSAFNFALQSHLFHFVVRGTIEDKKATIHYGTPTAPRKMVLPLPETPHLSNSMYDALRGKTLKTGDEIVIHVFDPASMGQRPVRLKVAGEEEITVMGQQRRTVKLDVDFMGARLFAWLGEEGDVLKEQGLLGMTLERVTREEALHGLTLSASADLAEVVSIESNIEIETPEALRKMTVRLAGIDTRPLFLAGGRQHFKNDILTIERESWPAAGANREFSGEIMRFLQPSPFIQSNDPLIIRQVHQIISPQDSDLVKAKKIVDWLYRHIEKRPVLSVPNATETLENRVGDCNEHAVLLAAMARAAGIPAQVEAGLVYQRGRFYYHAWNVLYLGDWITADATLGIIPADVTHIRLVRGGADRQIDLMGVIGKLKLEILETKP